MVWQGHLGTVHADAGIASCSEHASKINQKLYLLKRFLRDSAPNPRARVQMLGDVGIDRLEAEFAHLGRDVRADALERPAESCLLCRQQRGLSAVAVEAKAVGRGI